MSAKPSDSAGLKAALTAIKFNERAKPAQNINLIFAIKAYAYLEKNSALEAECDREIARIQVERDAAEKHGVDKPTT